MSPLNALDLAVKITASLLGAALFSGVSMAGVRTRKGFHPWLTAAFMLISLTAMIMPWFFSPSSYVIIMAIALAIFLGRPRKRPG